MVIGDIPNQRNRISVSWTSNEENALIELYPNNSNQHISKVLNKTKASIDNKGALLGLKKSSDYRQKVSRQNNQRKRHAWSVEEVNYLVKNYYAKSYAEIAETLNRTPTAVSQKARQMDLKKYQRTKPHKSS